MASVSFLKKHRTWEDWLGIGLGVAVGVSPWAAGETSHEIVMLNAAQIGLLVLGLATFELVDLRRWEEIAQLACGVWLTASPFLLGYADAGHLKYWHFALGPLLAALAVLELWQDWNLSHEELSERRKKSSPLP
jgi:hypothetical protein